MIKENFRKKHGLVCRYCEWQPESTEYSGASKRYCRPKIERNSKKSEWFFNINLRERPVSQHRQNLARKRRRIARLMTPNKSDRVFLPPASVIFAETLAAALLALSAIVTVK
jgi:hypothetical protein